MRQLLGLLLLIYSAMGVAVPRITMAQATDAAQPEKKLRPVGGPTIVQAGISEHVIYCDPTAAVWVHEAAKEIQRVLKVSTGVELPIAREPAAKMISLGNNETARRAGVTLAADAADDSFVLRVVGESLFIVGRDRADVPGWSSRHVVRGV